MTIYDKIEKLRVERNISKMDFYKAIELTPEGYSNTVKNNAIKVRTVEKAAQLFGLPVKSLFDDMSDIERIIRVFSMKATPLTISILTRALLHIERQSKIN